MYFHRLAAKAALSALAFAAPGFAAVQLGMVKDINAGSAETGSTPTNFMALDGKVYFSANTPGTGRELFVSEPGSSTVQLVADLAPNGASSDARLFGKANGRLIVHADAGNQIWENFLYRSQVVALDPASGQYDVLTQFTMDDRPGVFLPRGQFGNHVLFHNEASSALWASDGTVAGTQPLFQREWPDNYLASDQICTLDDRAVFTRNSSAGLELWISNGTSLGTGNIRQLPGVGGIGFATRAAGGCYFAVSTAGGWAVMLSNGTADGTGLILQSAAGELRGLAVDSAGLAYVVESSGTQVRLWRSDQAAPYWSAEVSAGAIPPVIAGGQLVFSTASGQNQTSFFVSDGTAAGTRPVLLEGQPLSVPFESGLISAGGYALLENRQNGYRISPAAATASQYTQDSPVPKADHALLGGRVYYAGSGVDGFEPWSSDGTVEGSQLVANVAWQTASSGLDDGPPSAVQGNLLFFGASTDPQDWRHRGLWRSDGTEAGTQQLPREAYNADSVSWIAPLAADVLFATAPDFWSAPNRLYRTSRDFSQTQPVTGCVPRSGGKAVRAGRGVIFAGTTGLCVMQPESSQANVLFPGTGKLLGSVGGQALLLHSDGLWRSDGTLAGTQLISPGLHGSSDPNVDAAYVLNGRLLFEGCTGNQYTCGLWSSDGTEQGTVLLRLVYWPIVDFAPFGNSSAFLADGAGTHLWVTDGTVAGTRYVAEAGRNIRGLAGTGGRLHMIDDFLSTPRYVVSDGTEAGTVAVPLLPGLSLSAWNKPIAVDDETVVFPCYLPNLGYEACAVDHRGQDLRVLGDYFQGPASSGTLGFHAAADGGVYVSIDDGRHGAELWRLTGDSLFSDSFNWR